MYTMCIICIHPFVHIFILHGYYKYGKILVLDPVVGLWVLLTL